MTTITNRTTKVDGGRISMCERKDGSGATRFQAMFVPASITERLRDGDTRGSISMSAQEAIESAMARRSEKLSAWGG